MIEDISKETMDKLNFSSFNLPDVNAHIPSPTQNDYSIGKITRYFVARPNYYSIVEVSQSDYQYYSSPYFISVKISWKISGPERNIYIKNILNEVGVYDYNVKTISRLKKTMPDLDRFLTDPLQFWRGF